MVDARNTKTVEAFSESGFLIVRDLISKNDIEDLRRGMKEASGLDESSYPDTWTPADAAQYEMTWPIIFNKDLLTIVSHLLGNKAVWTTHADLHINLRPGPGEEINWHRDNLYREFGVGPDWVDDYKMVRVAIYLDHHEQHRANLHVQYGSHKNGSGPEMSIETNPGDVIIFDQRLLHGTIPPKASKFSLFLSYGVDGIHSARHRGYYRILRWDLKYSMPKEEFTRRLIEHGMAPRHELIPELETTRGVHIKSSSDATKAYLTTQNKSDAANMVIIWPHEIG